MALVRNESVGLDLPLKRIERLSLREVLAGVDAGGRFLCQPNPRVLPSANTHASYKNSDILGDSSPHAPPGFGVTISAMRTVLDGNEPGGCAPAAKAMHAAASAVAMVWSEEGQGCLCVIRLQDRPGGG